MAITEQAPAGTSRRSRSARALDAFADVVVGLGVAAALVMGLGALALVVEASDSGIGTWVVETGSLLLRPLETPLAWVVSFDEPRLALAATLALGALVWAAAGWMLSALIRPR